MKIIGIPKVAIKPRMRTAVDLLNSGILVFDIISSNFSPYFLYASLYFIFLNGLIGVLSFLSKVFNSFSHSFLIDIISFISISSHKSIICSLVASFTSKSNCENSKRCLPVSFLVIGSNLTFGEKINILSSVLSAYLNYLESC